MREQRSPRDIYILPLIARPGCTTTIIDVVLMSTGTDLGMLPLTRPAPQAPRPTGAQAPHRHSRARRRPALHQTVRQASSWCWWRGRWHRNARTIVMNEPRALDPWQHNVLSCVLSLKPEGGLSIVQSTHRPDQTFLCSDIRDPRAAPGRVHAFGDPKDVITSRLVSAIYGVNVEVNSSLCGDRCAYACRAKKNLAWLQQRQDRREET